MMYTFAGLSLDVYRRELRRSDEIIMMQPQVFDVLHYLVANHDRLVSKDELLDNVWNTRHISESALSTRIKHARQAVGDNGREQRIIQTLHGRGYRVVADVVEASSRSIEGVEAKSQLAPITELPMSNGNKSIVAIRLETDHDSATAILTEKLAQLTQKTEKSISCKCETSGLYCFK